MTQENAVQTNNLRYSIIALALFIFVLWVHFPYWSTFLFDITEGKAGSFGDSFGTLNTLFSGFAFAGILISIYIQMIELRDTREELRGQKESLQNQNFEATFFQMLRTHNEITESIKSHKQVGRSAISAMAEELSNTFRNKHELRSVRKALNDFFTRTQPTSGHYLRNIYQILKYIDSACEEFVIPANKGKFYTNIVRAQLSTNELILLFYNCISTVQYLKFCDLVTKYEFFEHIPTQHMKPSEHFLFYEPKAFGDNTGAADLFKKYKNSDIPLNPDDVSAFVVGGLIVP